MASQSLKYHISLYRLIKLTSPYLNLFIAMGVILMNMGTPMTMYPPLFESELSIFCLVSYSWYSNAAVLSYYSITN